MNSTLNPSDHADRAGLFFQCWKRSPRTLVFVAAALAGLGFSIVLFAFDPARHGFYPQCTFHAWTGLNCPGCGGLRAVHQLLHGHLGAAWALNPLVICAAPFLLLGGLARVIPRLRPLDPLRLFNSPLVAWILVALIVGFGVLRNVL